MLEHGEGNNSLEARELSLRKKTRSIQFSASKVALYRVIAVKMLFKMPILLIGKKAWLLHAFKIPACYRQRQAEHCEFKPDRAT